MEMVGEHGRGGITARSDGRLQVAITLLDGRRVFRYIPKDRDPKRQLRRAEAELARLVEAREADLEPTTQTLAAFLRSWISGLHSGRRKPRPRTIEHYTYVVERKVIPALGHVRLDRLSERHVQRWLDEDPDSPRSVHHHRAVLRRALNVARRQRLIDRNPAIDVELPEIPAFEASPLTASEARALLAVGDRLSPLWRLAIDSGLRESELLGLAWDDVDLDAGSVTVRHQLVRSEGRWQFAPTKAGRSSETVHLGPSTVKALREHRSRMTAERAPSWRYHGLVFVSPKGEPIGRSGVLRLFHAACDAAGIERRRFHDLRGSSATFLQDEGIPEPVRMARLGHATTKMARHYAKVRDELDREAAMALERVIGG